MRGDGTVVTGATAPSGRRGPADVIPVVVPARRQLVVTWAAAALVLGVLLAVSRAGYSGLDDPNQGFQRPGLLDVGSLPAHPPPVTANIPRAGRRAVVFFARPGDVARLAAALASASDLRREAEVAVVVAGPVTSPTEPGGVVVVADPGGGLAAGYGMRTPRDGGPPVGYAIVDRSGRVRYATIDPGDASRLREVRTVLSAVP